MIGLADEARTSDLACWRKPAGSSRLVSLWDMLRVHADDFVTLLKGLDHARAMIVGLKSHLEETATPESRYQLWKLSLSDVRETIDKIEPICKVFELDAALSLMTFIREIHDKCSRDDLRNDIRHELTVSNDDFVALASKIDDLDHLVKAEFVVRVFMYVPRSDTKYFDEKPRLFGFPEMHNDIVDAGWCLGVGRPTAAVFHLMRIMEFAVRRLSKRLKISAKGIQFKNWGDILGPINDAVGKIKTRTARSDRYSEIVAHLGHATKGWRNTTMHVRRRFTPSQALAIFENVKTFVKSLAGDES
jgi:hypothetical protein